MHSKICVLMQLLKLVFELRKENGSTGTIIPNLNLVPSVCGKAAPLHDLFASLFIWFQSLVYPPHYLFSLPLVISGRCNKREAWKRNLMEKTCGKKNPSRRVVDG
jgi:hypothetical protein